MPILQDRPSLGDTQAGIRPEIRPYVVAGTLCLVYAEIVPFEGN